MIKALALAEQAEFIGSSPICRRARGDLNWRAAIGTLLWR
jgi:hypothetical protein